MRPVATTTRPARAGGAGVALALLSAATFGTSGTFASALIRAGWSPGAAVTVRIGVAALLLTVPALLSLRGQWARLRAAAGQITAYGLIAVAGAQLAFFNAVARMPVGVALLLEYLGIVLVVGWLWLRHGQRPRRLTVMGAVASLGGLALVLNLAGSARISPVGVIWALLAAVGLATYFVLSAADADPLPPVVMAWAGMCVGTAALAAVGYAGAVPMIATTRAVDLLGYQVSWIVPVAGLSVVAAAIAYLAGIGAARRLGAKLASFIGLVEVLFAILFAWLLLGELPTVLQFLGGALIVAGVTLVRVDEFRGDAAGGWTPAASVSRPEGSRGARPALRAAEAPQPARMRRWHMEAAIGDRLHVHGNIVGNPERTGEIVEVRGAGGTPPYLVRFDDGHTGLVFPGPDATIEHPARDMQ